MPERSGRPDLLPAVHRVCGTSDSEIGWGYVKQIALLKLAADTVDVSRSAGGMRESEGCGWDVGAGGRRVSWRWGPERHRRARNRRIGAARSACSW